jgi:DNA-3-methyladenine glycosylase II
MRKAVLHLKKSDPLMRAIIERVGPCRMEFGEPTFHSLAEAIVYQQLNGKAAVTIFKRFAALAGDPVTPEGILKLSAEQLRAVGLSKQKSSYLFDMAERAKRGDLNFSKLADMSDDEVIEHLTQVKGVGVWTAHMFLMFTLRRANVLPTGDFGIRMAIHKQYLERAAKRKNGTAQSKNKKVGAKLPKRKMTLPTPEQMEK